MSYEGHEELPEGGLGQVDSNKWKVYGEIPPKSNRLVLFRPRLLHCVGSSLNSDILYQKLIIMMTYNKVFILSDMVARDLNGEGQPLSQVFTQKPSIPTGSNVIIMEVDHFHLIIMSQMSIKFNILNDTRKTLTGNLGQEGVIYLLFKVHQMVILWEESVVLVART